ncbi:MAG: hypothetical protein KF729_02525 [Sandaracinaceae bacterium]|nr:hypothetical protein [Sandaracinaceae bacterium]
MRWTALALASSCFAAPATAQFPEWLEREPAAWAGRREPQLESPAAQLARAPEEEPGPLSGALLVCRLRVTDPENGFWDTFAAPDLRIVVQRGRRRMEVWGTENAYEHAFSLPGVDLGPRDALRFAIADRDVTGDEPIARFEARYEGRFPLTLSARYVSGECRRVAPDRVDARLAAARGHAEGAVARVEDAAPDLAREDLGRPTAALGEARRHLLHAAALGSWREPGVAGLRLRLELGERAFTTALTRAVAAAHRSAPRVGQDARAPDGGAVLVRRLACGANARAMEPTEEQPTARCVAHLEVEAPAQSDAAPAWLGAIDALDARGSRHEARQTLVLGRTDGGRLRVAVVLSPFTPRRAILRLAGGRAFLRAS